MNLPAALKQTIASIFVWLQFVWVYISYPEYLPQFIDAFNSIFQGIFTLSFFFHFVTFIQIPFGGMEAEYFDARSSGIVGIFAMTTMSAALSTHLLNCH